jgi:hypothetical protein
MRLDTLERRAVGAKLAMSADGKSIIGVRAGKYVRVWDAATGKLLQKRELSIDDAWWRFWLSCGAAQPVHRARCACSRIAGLPAGPRPVDTGVLLRLWHFSRGILRTH